jgi:hypothetical protein
MHRESWVKVSVVLFERQIADLDRCVSDSRRRTGSVLNRTGIIRAVIDGFLNSAIDRKAIRSEADLRAEMTRRLSR